MKFRVNFHENGEHTHDLYYARRQEAVESAKAWADNETCSATVYQKHICGRTHYLPIKAFYSATSPDNPARIDVEYRSIIPEASNANS